MLYQEIYQAVSRIPAGQVASYGQVAQAVGRPRGARLVGWALRQLPPDTTIPWQRVVNRQGRISIVNPHFSPSRQRELLEAEGAVFVLDADSWLLHQPVWCNLVEPPGAGL